MHWSADVDGQKPVAETSGFETWAAGRIPVLKPYAERLVEISSEILAQLRTNNEDHLGVMAICFSYEKASAFGYTSAPDPAGVIVSSASVPYVVSAWLPMAARSLPRSRGEPKTRSLDCRYLANLESRGVSDAFILLIGPHSGSGIRVPRARPCHDNDGYKTGACQS